MSGWGAFWFYLGLAFLCSLGLIGVLIRKAITSGDCRIPDDDGENYP